MYEYGCSYFITERDCVLQASCGVNVVSLFSEFLTVSSGSISKSILDDIFVFSEFRCHNKFNFKVTAVKK
jgi:hypothetical protein